MKVAITLFSAVALFASAQASAAQSVQSAKQTLVTLKVSGMQCHLCAGTVERTAKALDGVIAATADQPKGLAEITYDAAKTSAEEIARLLTKRAGFKTEVPSKPKK